jgi:phosphoglucomutase
MPPGHGYTGGSMALDPLAGHSAPVSVLIDVPKLTGVLLCRRPDPAIPEQRVAFGTSGHRVHPSSDLFMKWRI